MIDVIKTIYEMRSAIEAEFGEVKIIRFLLDQKTPANNMGIEVLTNELVFPFYVDETDFEDVPLLISFMIAHIKSQLSIAKAKEIQGDGTTV